MLMATRTWIREALFLLIFAGFAGMSVTTSATVTAMPTVSKHVHRHKRDEDQGPKPILCNPCHDYFSYRNFDAAIGFRKMFSGAAGVLLHPLVLRCREDSLGFFDFVWRAMRNDDKLTGFDLRLVFDDAVLGNTDAEKARA